MFCKSPIGVCIQNHHRLVAANRISMKFWNRGLWASLTVGGWHVHKMHGLDHRYSPSYPLQNQLAILEKS